jgi:hypothetical protein
MPPGGISRIPNEREDLLDRLMNGYGLLDFRHGCTTLCLVQGDVSLGIPGRFGHDRFFLSFLALVHIFLHNNPEEQYRGFAKEWEEECSREFLTFSIPF